MRLVLSTTLTLLIFSTAVFADDKDDDRFRPNPWQFNAKFGMNISAPSTLAASDKRFPFSTGLALDYFTTRVMGGFVSVETMTRGFNQSGSVATSLFADVMAGFSVRIGSRWFTDTSTSLFRFAGFYAAPFSNYEGPLTPPLGNSSSGYFGLSFAQDVLFPVSENLKLGFSVGGKIGVTEAVPGASVRFYEAGLSFVAAVR